jgi:hypothetical protein
MDTDIQEYLDCSNNMRHYSNHQAALITAFVTLNGAIAALIFGTGTLSDFFQDFGAKVIALGISVLFGIKIQSAIMMWDHFFNRAVELEGGLGLKQYTTLPGYPTFPIRPAKWAIQILVVATLVFWFLSLLGRW